jgi:hypothetical protein
MPGLIRATGECAACNPMKGKMPMTTTPPPPPPWNLQNVVRSTSSSFLLTQVTDSTVKKDPFGEIPIPQPTIPPPIIPPKTPVYAIRAISVGPLNANDVIDVQVVQQFSNEMATQLTASKAKPIYYGMSVIVTPSLTVLSGDQTEEVISGTGRNITPENDPYGMHHDVREPSGCLQVANTYKQAYVVVLVTATMSTPPPGAMLVVDIGGQINVKRFVPVPPPKK